MADLKRKLASPSTESDRFILGTKVVDSLPENDAGCAELMEILVDYLPKRYPTLFEKIDCKGGGIWNKVTNERITDIRGRKGVDALLVCSRLNLSSCTFL